MPSQRVKIKVSRLVLDTLERDSKHFQITKEKLCNEILVTFSIRKMQEIEIEDLDEKAYLQFTMNRATFEYYKMISKNIENEVEFIRNLFTNYTHLNPFYREIILFRDKLIVLKNYISKKEKIHISFNNRLEEVIVEKIIRCPMTDYIKLKTNKGEYYLNELRIIF